LYFITKYSETAITRRKNNKVISYEKCCVFNDQNI